MAGAQANPQLPTQVPAEAAKEADVTATREKQFPKVASGSFDCHFQRQSLSGPRELVSDALLFRD